MCYWHCLTYWWLFAFCNLPMKSMHNTTKTKTSLGNRVGIYNVIRVSLCLHLLRTLYRKTGTTQVPNSKINETSMAVFYLDIVYAQSINLWAQGVYWEVTAVCCCFLFRKVMSPMGLGHVAKKSALLCDVLRTWDIVRARADGHSGVSGKYNLVRDVAHILRRIHRCQVQLS